MKMSRAYEVPAPLPKLLDDFRKIFRGQPRPLVEK
jgi:hypothetical protein